jgi:release factor glutamine methyltransferase
MKSRRVRQSEFGNALEAVLEPSEAASTARIVFEDVFDVLKKPDQPLTDREESELLSIQNQLLQGEPVQYVLGMADFMGLRFKVDARVLIPRMDTEELVIQVERWIKKNDKKQAKLLDVGTGSGCIALTLKSHFPSLHVTALDYSAAAIELAAENAKVLGLDVNFIEANFLQKSQQPDSRFDIVVSNPPYIPPSERIHMPTRVIEYEPDLALFVPEDDPMLFYQAIGEYAFTQLNPDGACFFEINEFRALEVMEVLKKIGFKTVECIQDLSGADRVVWAAI